MVEVNNRKRKTYWGTRTLMLGTRYHKYRQVRINPRISNIVDQAESGNEKNFGLDALYSDLKIVVIGDFSVGKILYYQKIRREKNSRRNYIFTCFNLNHAESGHETNFGLDALYSDLKIVGIGDFSIIRRYIEKKIPEETIYFNCFNLNHAESGHEKIFGLGALYSDLK